MKLARLATRLRLWEGCSMSDTITLSGVRAFGYHGVLQSEKDNGQEFIVDVTIGADFDAAVATDDVSQTIDYGAVAGLIVDIVTGTLFNLIESLADRICREIVALPGVRTVSVTVHKPSAPIAVEFSDVCVTRSLP